MQDAKPGSSVTGKPKNIRLKVSTAGRVYYVTSTGTKLVEWMLAMEGAGARICHHAARALTPRGFVASVSGDSGLQPPPMPIIFNVALTSLTYLGAVEAIAVACVF